MFKINGIWNGEYSFNHGTEDEPDIKYFHFEMQITENENVFEGRFIDQTLNTKESVIRGFLEDSFISLIRTCDHSPEFIKTLSFRNQNTNRPLEFNFSGNYNEKDCAFEGIWELVVDEENEDIQNTVLVELRTGACYMRKI